MDDCDAIVALRALYIRYISLYIMYSLYISYVAYIALFMRYALHSAIRYIYDIRARTESVIVAVCHRAA